MEARCPSRDIRRRVSSGCGVGTSVRQVEQLYHRSTIDRVPEAGGRWKLGPRGRELVVVPEHVVHPGLLGGWWLSRPSVPRRRRMRLHANAALSLRQRERMVGRVLVQGWSLTQAAEAAEVSERTCAKWVARYRAGGRRGERLGSRSRTSTRPYAGPWPKISRMRRPAGLVVRPHRGHHRRVVGANGKPGTAPWAR